MRKSRDIGIRNWWVTTSQDDVEHVLAKLVDYGPLVVHAAATAAMFGRPTMPTQQATEALIIHYLAGKLGRIAGGIAVGGNRAMQDCWADLARYAMMGRYVRQFGSWP